MSLTINSYQNVLSLVIALFFLCGPFDIQRPSIINALLARSASVTSCFVVDPVDAVGASRFSSYSGNEMFDAFANSRTYKHSSSSIIMIVDVGFVFASSDHVHEGVVFWCIRKTVNRIPIGCLFGPDASTVRADALLETAFLNRLSLSAVAGSVPVSVLFVFVVGEGADGPHSEFLTFKAVERDVVVASAAIALSVAEVGLADLFLGPTLASAVPVAIPAFPLRETNDGPLPESLTGQVFKVAMCRSRIEISHDVLLDVKGRVVDRADLQHELRVGLFVIHKSDLWFKADPEIQVVAITTHPVRGVFHGCD